MLTAERVSEVLEAAGVKKFWDDVRVLERRPGVLVALYVRYHDITFDELHALSIALGTRRINIDNEIREDGYCETCRHSYVVTVVTVLDPIVQ